MLTPSPRQPRLRFTLAGLFVMTLGVAVGLAWWRLPGVVISHAMLAGFTTWFLGGLVQQIWSGIRRIKQFDPCLAREHRWGLVVQVALLIGIVTLILIVAAVDLRLLFTPSYQTQGAWERRWLIEFLFFFAIISAYWAPPKAVITPSWISTASRRLLGLALLGGGAYWGAKVLVEPVAIVGLGQIALRGVELAQPTRWSGRNFYPANLNLGLADKFFGDLLTALALLAVATVMNALLLRFWRAGRLARLPFLIISLPLLLRVATLAYRFWSTGLPRLSPFFVTAIYEEALEVKALVWVFVLALSAALATSLTVVSSDEGDLSRRSPSYAPFLHEHFAAICLLLFAIIWGVATDLWRIMSLNFKPQLDWLLTPEIFWWPVVRSCQEYALESPVKMIHLATLVVIVRYLWRSRQGRSGSSQCWMVEPERFLAAWLISICTIALLVPIVVGWSILATVQWLSP